MNFKVNNIHKKALQTICKDSGNDSMNNANGSVATHIHNLQLLRIEDFKITNDLNRTFMKDIFAKLNSYQSL